MNGERTWTGNGTSRSRRVLLLLPGKQIPLRNAQFSFIILFREMHDVQRTVQFVRLAFKMISMMANARFQNLTASSFHHITISRWIQQSELILRLHCKEGCLFSTSVCNDFTDEYNDTELKPSVEQRVNCISDFVKSLRNFCRLFKDILQQTKTMKVVMKIKIKTIGKVLWAILWLNQSFRIALSTYLRI